LMFASAAKSISSSILVSIPERTARRQGDGQIE
jgi:hypothetical protein